MNNIKCMQTGDLHHTKMEKANRVYSPSGLAVTLCARQQGDSMNIDEKDSLLNEDFRVMEEKLRIRKLTPRECWRLMDQSQLIDGKWDDTTFEAAQKVNSNAQLYKQAGNSIVVGVLVHIFKAMEEQGIM